MCPNSASESLTDVLRDFVQFIQFKKQEYPSKIDDWKTSEKNNSTIAVNVLHTKEMEMEICPAYISKYNSNHEKQIILLMILNEKG